MVTIPNSWQCSFIIPAIGKVKWVDPILWPPWEVNLIYTVPNGQWFDGMHQPRVPLFVTSQGSYSTQSRRRSLPGRRSSHSTAALFNCYNSLWSIINHRIALFAINQLHWSRWLVLRFHWFSLDSYCNDESLHRFLKDHHIAVYHNEHNSFLLQLANVNSMNGAQCKNTVPDILDVSEQNFNFSFYFVAITMPFAPIFAWEFSYQWDMFHLDIRSVYFIFSNDRKKDKKDGNSYWRTEGNLGGRRGPFSSPSSLQYSIFPVFFYLFTFLVALRMLKKFTLISISHCWIISTNF